MAGGRPKASEPYVKWKVHIPAQLAARVEMRFFDPIRGKPRYGSRHELLTELLEKWLAEQDSSPSGVV